MNYFMQKMTGSTILVSCALYAAPLAAQSLPAAPAGPAADEPAETIVADDRQGQLQDIVVTAQKRSQSLQKVPLAVTAFGSAELEARGLMNVADIATLTPGLSLNANAGVVLPILRGVGNPSNAAGNESSVAVYLDGIYFTRLSAGFFSLANIERVEVLKGPQGTLFGRNSSGGVVQIVTPDPSHDQTIKGQLTYANRDTVEGNFYAGTGLTDRLAIDISFAGRSQGDGYGRNITTGNRFTYSDYAVVRSKLLWEPTDTTKVVLTGFYGSTKDSQLGNTYPGTIGGYQSAPFVPRTNVGFYNTSQDLDNFLKVETVGGSLRVDQDLGFANLASISSYVKNKERGGVDGDYSERPDFYGLIPATTRQYTQEIQLSSNAGSAVDWIGGFFYYNATSGYEPFGIEGGSSIPGDIAGDDIINQISFFSKQRAKSYAGYGQATYEILPRLKLTGGLRYTSDHLRGSGYGFLTLAGVPGTIPIQPLTTDKDSIGKWTFKAALDYQLTDDILAYASYSRGFKSATFNILPFTPPATRPEVLDAYEFGIKSELLDRRLRLNASIFQYDIADPQVQLLTVAGVIYSNAGGSRVRGLEFDGQAILASGLSITFGATFLDAEYTDYANAPSFTQNPNPPFGSIATTIDAAGRKLPQSAKFTSTLGFLYTTSLDKGELTLSGDWYHNSGFFWEANNFLRQPAHDLVAARVMYKPNDTISISAWGRNLLGEKVAAFGGSQAGPSGFPYIAGRPRTYGVTVGFDF